MFENLSMINAHVGFLLTEAVKQFWSYTLPDANSV